MIKHVTIKNFKGIKSLGITPKKFNVLVGRNNTGKTSILEAISACMNPNLIRDLLMYKYDSFFINYSTDKASIKIDTEDNKIKRVSIRKATPEQILNLLKNDLLELVSNKDEVYIGIDKYIAIEKSIKTLDKDKIYQVSLDSIVVLVNNSGKQTILPGESYKELLTDALSKLYDTHTSKNPKDPAKHTPTGNMIKHDYSLAAYLYFSRKSRKNSFIIDKKNNITFINEPLISTGNIEKSQKRALQLENMIKHDNIIPNLIRFNFDSLVLDTGDGTKEVPMESMGDGFKSLISILLKLYENESDVILIEEPENHMHPGYIRQLIHYIISIANKSQIQLFITTHSQDFLYMLTSNDALPENDREFLKKELLILQLSKWKDDTILSNLDYNDSVSDMEDLLLDLRGI